MTVLEAVSRELTLAKMQRRPMVIIHTSTRETGMPYVYYFTRTHTFAYKWLIAKDKEVRRRVMKARGDTWGDAATY